MWSILENVPCALEKKMYSSAFGWNVLKMSMRSFSSNISFKTCVSLLIFCFGDLSIGVSGVLKSPAIICYCQFLLLCLSVFVLCIDVLLCWVHYVVSFFISCNLYFKVCFVWCENCYSCFLLLHICVEYIFLSSHFQSICLKSWGLKWFSCTQLIYGSCFCIQSASLCLLVEALNPFTFKVIIDIYILIAIF